MTYSISSLCVCLHVKFHMLCKSAASLPSSVLNLFSELALIFSSELSMLSRLDILVKGNYMYLLLHYKLVVFVE